LNFFEICKTHQDRTNCQVENYEAATRTFEIILPDGGVSIVPRRQVQRISANEELAGLILSRTRSN
jgi:hypothetical protein